MSYFDDASLVLIPSGYKDQKIFSVKPLDGSGDLTFSRASNATRVASDGLIEKVRTNLVTYSNTFSDAAWTKTNSTVTSGQAGYDGTTNGWKITATGANNDKIIQSVSTTGLITASVYAKAGNVNFVIIGIGGAATWFNLSSGAVGANISALNPKIESVGNGYYRCSISVANLLSTNFELYLANSNGNTTTSAGDYILLQNSQVETGDIATDYIATTTTAVSVGPVSGLPRLDYLNSSCPRLLLEPQRTNIALFSEQFNNVNWVNINTTVTANTTISPDGYTNADTIAFTASDGAVCQGIVAGAFESQTHTVSVYARVASGTATFRLKCTHGSVLDYISSDFTATTTWQRFTFSATFGATIGTSIVYGVQNGSNATAKSVIFYGFQLEANAAYATSYIPTLGTSVTRVAETAIKTSATALIGQTEGTIFLEFQKNAGVDAANIAFSLSDGTSDNLIYYNFEGPVIEFIASSVLQARKSGGINLVAGTNKIAVYYKANDFGIYLNGVSIFTDTTGSVGAMSKFNLGSFFNDAFPVGTPINQALLFKTRLSNSDLATLTTL
jgi:hypothetical protein